MSSSPSSSPAAPRSAVRGWPSRALGFLAVLVLGLAGIEVLLRWQPPDELELFLGAQSTLQGALATGRAPGVIAYEDYGALRRGNPVSLGGPDEDPPRPIDGSWLFFGTSFVHMRGALCDTTEELLPELRCIHLDDREVLPVRVAQVRTLLEHGVRPARIVMTMMPVDVGYLGWHALDSLRVSSRGAQVYEPRPPPAPFDLLVRHSRLALAAWVRTGRHRDDPDFARHTLYNEVSPRLRGDLARILGELGELSARHGVPVTLVLIPTERQAIGKGKYALADAVTEIAREAGLDCVDPRELFLGASDHEALYIHDGHLSKRGYRFVARELARHCGLGDEVVWPEDEVEEP